jgi:hypothetical protein
MVCAEHVRLREEYQKALNAWRGCGPELVSLGYPIEVRSRIRKAALGARMKAAKDLYLHTVTCLQCNVAKKETSSWGALHGPCAVCTRRPHRTQPACQPPDKLSLFGEPFDARGGLLGSRVLCVGVDMGLLVTRRLLLLSRGHDAAIAFPAEIDESLLSEGFDLIVISVSVSVSVGEADRARILAILPTGMRTLALTSFVNPDELLAMVEQAFG